MSPKDFPFFGASATWQVSSFRFPWRPAFPRAWFLEIRPRLLRWPWKPWVSWKRTGIWMARCRKLWPSWVIAMKGLMWKWWMATSWQKLCISCWLSPTTPMAPFMCRNGFRSAVRLDVSWSTDVSSRCCTPDLVGSMHKDMWGRGEVCRAALQHHRTGWLVSGCFIVV